MILQKIIFFHTSIYVCCGYISTRVIGGTLTTIDQYPILVQLLIDSWSTQQYLQYCAGSILTSRHVLSSAHCFGHTDEGGRNNPTFWKIRVGSTYRSHGGTIVNLKQIVVHPGFNELSYENDVAVAVLSEPLAFNSAVRQGTIPQMNTEIEANSPCMLVGWGATEINGEPSEHLMRVNMWTIDLETCRERYKGIGARIVPSMICAGRLDVGGADGCHGDSGGPLIHNGLIVGLVSFGHECGHQYYPGVYTKVSYFTEWIVNTVSSTS